MSDYKEFHQNEEERNENEIEKFEEENNNNKVSESERKEEMKCSFFYHGFALMLSLITLIFCAIIKNTFGIVFSVLTLIVSCWFFYKLIKLALDENLVFSNGRVFNSEHYSYYKLAYGILFGCVCMFFLICILDFSLARNWKHLPQKCEKIYGCTMVSPVLENNNRAGKDIIKQGVKFQSSVIKERLYKWLNENTTK